MDVSTLLPLLVTGASTGLSCGLSCGACGNPMINVFLASYLFTHMDRWKKSMTAFIAYHTGKAVMVSILCMLVSWFGSQIVDEQGNFFGINLHRMVYVVMLVFMAVLIFRWFRENKNQCYLNKMESDACHGTGDICASSQFANAAKEENHTRCSRKCKRSKRIRNQFGSMILYGFISGMSPCASLLVVMSYASALTTWQAIFVGLSFSLANSVIPLLLLTVLTGLLSEQMHKEIPTKIRYFQLVTYIIFASVLIKNLFLTF